MMAQELGRALATRPFAADAAKRSTVQELVAAFLAGSGGEERMPQHRPHARGGRSISRVVEEAFIMGRMLRHLPQFQHPPDSSPWRRLRRNIFMGFAQEWGRAAHRFGSTPTNLTRTRYHYPDSEGTYLGAYTARTTFNTEMDFLLFKRARVYMKRAKAILRSVDPTALRDVRLPETQHLETGTILSRLSLRVALERDPLPPALWGRLPLTSGGPSRPASNGAEGDGVTGVGTK